MQYMYWLITISRRADVKKLQELYQRLEVPILYTSVAFGTATSQTLDLLGIARSEKAVHQTVVTYNKLYQLKQALERDFQIDLPDRGIALAVPLSGIATKTALDFFAGGQAEDAMNNIQNPKPDTELIVVVCTKGHTEQIMDVARSAGAGGGTVFHAKGTAPEGAERFFGVSIVDEKEIVYIVSTKEKRNAIMQAITDAAGVGTEAHALVFSLPVSETVGMRLQYDDHL